MVFDQGASAAVTAEGTKQNGQSKFIAGRNEAQATHVPLGSIKSDAEIQQRVGIDRGLVEEYAETIGTWIESAPVILFDDGTHRWLADGFHRVYAAGRIEMETVPAIVHQGTKRDAILFAVGANRTHGLRRTNADKRRAVETLLGDSEWSAWSDRRIAEEVGISPTTVGTIRAQVSNLDTCDAPQDQVSSLDTCEPPPEPVIEAMPEKRVGKDGKAYPAPKPKAQPKEDHNKARVAMHAAHAVTVALGQIPAIEPDLLPSDAQTLMANLRKTLERLEARFPIETTEGTDNA